ncbi:MAG: amidohydrolase [Myxococcales bacterium]|nr:amidohydrolase [Myxococcales bacterium]
MAQLPYRLIDADNHYYEAPDCFTRHIEAKYRDATLNATKNDRDEWDVHLGGKPWHYMDVKFEKTNKPGSMIEILHQKGDVNWADSYSRENMLAGFQDNDARLALMDEQGVEAAILLPTLAVVVEQTIVDEADLTHASLRAFNRWLEDDWGYAYQNRIFAVPLLSLLDVDQACEELDRVLALGARMVHLRPGPQSGRSPADPCFDSFWARLNEAKIPLALHLSDSGYNAMMSIHWGEAPAPPVREQSAFQWAFSHGDRPVMETIGSMIYNNLFTRFPDLRAVSIENGSGWVEYLLTTLDKKKGMARYGPWPHGRFQGRASDVFRRHFSLTPYPEDDVPRLIEFVGADRVLFGSDYPHPEGTKRPIDFAELLTTSDEAETRQIMRGNAARLLDLDA